MVLLLAPAAWSQPSLPPLPPPPPLPPGFTPAPDTTPATVDLATYARALRSYAKIEISNPVPRAGTQAAYVQLARTELAAAPYVRDVSVGIFQELDRYQTANHEAGENSGPKKPKGSLNTLAQHPEKIVQPLIDAGKAEEKAGDDAKARRQAVEKSIAARLDSLEQQLSTPTGQKFSLPSRSPLYRALTKPDAFAKELENNLGAVPK